MRVKFTDKKMNIVYSLEKMPNKVTKTLFLAGPCPRKDMELSWHQDALDILEKLGYDGTVMLPMYRDRKPRENLDYEGQIFWEKEMMDAADCIVFWIPRQFRPDFEMIGLTTNVEFGRYMNTHKCVAGAPKDAEKVAYLKDISKDIVKWHDSLEDTLKAALDFIGEGSARSGIEATVPNFIFTSSQFQQWYTQLKEAGNRLDSFELLYNFFMPIQKKLFLALWKPSIYISDEKRNKDIEFVVGRTDICSVLAYLPHPDIMKTKIVVVEEFRSPVANWGNKVFELPGGSSMDPNEAAVSVARNELFEETGLSLPTVRFVLLNIKQSAATLCSHQINLFGVKLTKEELESIETNIAHGNTEDTERVYVHIMTVKEALKMMDWTNCGMVFEGLSEASSIKRVL